MIDKIVDKVSPTITNIDMPHSMGGGGMGSGAGAAWGVGGLVLGALLNNRDGGLLGGGNGNGGAGAAFALSNAINASTSSILGELNTDNVSLLTSLCGLSKEIASSSCASVSAIKDSTFGVVTNLNAGFNNVTSNLSNNFANLQQSLCCNFNQINTNQLTSTNTILNAINSCCNEEQKSMSAIANTLTAGFAEVICAIKNTALNVEIEALKDQLTLSRMREAEEVTVSRTTAAVKEMLNKLSPCIPKS